MVIENWKLLGGHHSIWLLRTQCGYGWGNEFEFNYH
jgi:hypothetical protein